MSGDIVITPEAEQLFNAALTHHQLGNFQAAEVGYRQCITAAPQLDLAWGNLGRCLASLGRHQEAIEAYEKAFELYSLSPEFLVHKGLALRALGQHPLARATFDRALSIAPSYPDTLNALGILELDEKHFTEAENLFTRALSCCAADEVGQLHRAATWNNIGVLRYRDFQDLSGAIDAYIKALGLAPDNSEYMSNLASTYLDVGQLDKALALYDKASSLCANPLIQSNYLMALLYHTATSPDEILIKHRQWATRLGLPDREEQVPDPPSRRPWLDSTGNRRPLRIGYISADFRLHAVSQFLWPVITHHSSNVEVFAYSNVAVPDAMTAAYQARISHFRSIAQMSDRELDCLIRSDELDILVELSGHTEGNRLSALARKPAPIICSWIGYPATTGLVSIDYRFVDQWTDPPDADAQSSERLIRLKSGFNCFEPQEKLPEVSKLPALREGFITFGSANNARKLNDETLTTWAHILRAVPNSRLLLKANQCTDPLLQERIRSIFRSHHVESDRVVYRGFVSGQKNHLAFYHEVDIALDPFPYNGTTTTCDALSMGVPVVALCGTAHHARVSYSILTRVGLGELATNSIPAYVSLASSLASQVEKLSSLRDSLRQMFFTSPLCWHQGFVNELEQTYAKLCATENAT